MPDNVKLKRPRLLWNAIIALYVQALLNAGGGVLFVYLAGVEVDHGRDAPEMYVLGYVSLVIAVVLLVGAVLLTRGVSWARFPIAVIESLGIISGLIMIFSGVIAGISNLVLCVLVLVNLFHREVRAWFETAQFPPASGQAAE